MRGVVSAVRKRILAPADNAMGATILWLFGMLGLTLFTLLLVIGLLANSLPLILAGAIGDALSAYLLIYGLIELGQLGGKHKE